MIRMSKVHFPTLSHNTLRSQSVTSANCCGNEGGNGLLAPSVQTRKSARKALIAFRSAVLGPYMRALHARGVNPKKVVFSSFKGASFSDSPRAIAEALHEMRHDADIVFQLGKEADAPAWVRRVAPRSLRWVGEMSTARVYVDNFNRPFYQIKFSDQKYVQTWHGDRGFKRVLYDMDPDGGFPDYKYMDLAVAGSDFCEKMYRTAFRYGGEVLKVGLPRNDALVNPMPMREARRRTGLPQDKKILLYAPTFRDSARGGLFHPPFDLAAAVSALRAETGEDWICAARAHDLNAGVAGADADVTKYPDMAELMMASDMLLTDYSSCAGDFPLLGRPTVLYHPAERFERALYFDVEKSPYRIAHTEAELRDLLIQTGDARQNADEILAFFGTHETGRSAAAVAARISEWMGAK